MGDADNKVKKPVELTKKQELNNHVSKLKLKKIVIFLMF